ncbi:uncharacterized protein PHACADRAFT_209784 [Phanerochaete carnosa HHB-10118-sp]|uniref:Uncharacterized protein n=1 Tax=Phanerochaete carnosa (strain HHB-10118-sp) TaxID=650164 RepID=K5VR59_PHACS|nr:uncharacterized protein PHACADRAFT_209784 [Phanerochaete carnosa HHB-10118-sp]EKM53953.1 hypothetical protein PHACADRAFT_209784 [Phanerochaete carnosa HHB-10118-sp]
MSTIERLLPHAHQYPEGIISDEGLPKPPFSKGLPVCWERKATSPVAPVYNLPWVVNTDGPTTHMQLNEFIFGESERSALFIAECGIDPSYPFYYYEIRIIFTRRLQSDPSRIIYTKNGAILGGSRFIDELELKKILRPAVNLVWDNVKKPAPIYTRISTNLGQHKFTFDLSTFTEKPEWRKFRHGAMLLPIEVVAIIATFAALATTDDTAGLSRLAMVFHTWAKICRPVMYERIQVRSVVQLHRLHTIFRSLSVLHLPHEVHIGGEVARPVTAPSMALVLSSLGHHLRQSQCISWSGTRMPGDDVAAHIQEAPPRVETGISALLRPLRNLDSLHLCRIKFQSLTQLFRVFRGLPRVREIHLKDIELLKAPERYYWPPSLILTELQVLKIVDCSIPPLAIPALVSLGIWGMPGSSALQQRRELNGISPHYHDEHAVLQIAQVLGHLHTLLGENAGQMQCIFNLGGRQLEEGQTTEYMSGKIPQPPERAVKMLI